MRRFFLFVMLLILTGCGAVPQPYRHSQTGFDTSKLKLRDGGIVKVGQVDGPSRPMAAILSNGVVGSLEVRNIPATTSDIQNAAYELKSQMVVHKFSQGHNQTQEIGQIYWRLYDRTGQEIADFQQNVRATPQQWQLGDQGLVDVVVDWVADQIANQIQDTQVQEAQPVQQAAIKIALTDIKNAPGQGRADLSKAMLLTLRQGGATLVSPRKLDGETYRIWADFEVLAPYEGRQRVQIAWVVEDPEGVELGRVNQSNRVDAGALDGAWGKMAFDVARAALDGIGALIERDRLNKQWSGNRDTQNATSLPGKRGLVLPPSY